MKSQQTEMSFPWLIKSPFLSQSHRQFSFVFSRKISHKYQWKKTFNPSSCAPLPAQAVGMDYLRLKSKRKRMGFPALQASDKWRCLFYTLKPEGKSQMKLLVWPGKSLKIAVTLLGSMSLIKEAKPTIRPLYHKVFVWNVRHPLC